ncbi:MAG: PEP-CTERM sorting domain-containing protein [Pirellulaceae bacterium]|nr:PEP-CTERM sorting domain-containing protein [Pirellulaceae bacterium]
MFLTRRVLVEKVSLTIGQPKYGNFDTADLIVAFSSGIDSAGGRYEQESAGNLVPEPSGLALLALSLWALLGCQARSENPAIGE